MNPTTFPPEQANLPLVTEPEVIRNRHAQAQADANRMVIRISPEEHRVTDEACAALATDKTIFQRMGKLVHIVRDESKLANVIRAPDAPRIVNLPSAGIRERVVRVAQFKRLQKSDSTWIPAHPPEWVVPQIEARGAWPNIRPLENVVETPMLRPDGSILSTPGYDELTGLLFEPTPGTTFLPLPDQPDVENAQSAAEELFDVVRDFPFKSEAHRSAWLAGLLTPFARYAFPGPAPMFLADANTSAAGKSLLMDVLGVIVHGRPMPRISVLRDEDKWRTLLTSLLMNGGLTMLLDNLKGQLGGAAFEALLTGTEIQDRALGGNAAPTVKAFAIWYGTGNNCQVTPDMTRRIVHIRLESPYERPEDRPLETYAHPDRVNKLPAFVRKERPRLVRAVLTILRAYYLAGRPEKAITGWGSFPGWERLIPQCISWLGYVDPGETRSEFRETADPESQAMHAFLHGLVEMGAVDAQTAIKGSDIEIKLRDDEDQFRKAGHPEDVSWPSMREAVSQLATKGSRVCDPDTLGKSLRGKRDKVFGDLRLRAEVIRRSGVLRWYAERIHPNSGAGMQG